MIKFRTPIGNKTQIFQEIEYNKQVIGSIYTYTQDDIKITVYQTLVPNLEFYKKLYNWYGEDNGFMFIYFSNLEDLLKAKGMRC